MTIFPSARQPKISALRGWTGDSTAKWRALPWGNGWFPPRLFAKARRAAIATADNTSVVKTHGIIVADHK